MNTAFQFSDNWKDAKEWAIAMRDTYLVQFYGKYSLNGRYVFIEKSACSDILQKRLAIDTIYTSAKTGGSICVEEKIVQWPGRYPYDDFFLETKSFTVKGHESLGWMHYAKADYLLYAFEREDLSSLDVYFINFPELRDWFWKVYERYQICVMGNTFNHTEGRKVPIRDVVRSVKSTRYLVTVERCIHIPYRSMRKE